MAIRTFLTLAEAQMLDDAVRRHNVRLRYIVREVIWDWVYDPTTGRARAHGPEEEPGEPHREISALIPDWSYGALKWKSIGGGFHMRQAFREAILRWLALDAEGKAHSPTMDSNAMWSTKRFTDVPDEHRRALIREIVQAHESTGYRPPAARPDL